MRTPKVVMNIRKTAVAAALVAAVGVLAAQPALAREHDRDWRAWHRYGWHRHAYVYFEPNPFGFALYPPAPAYVYAPPPVVYAPAPVYAAPGVNLVVPIHIR